MVHLYELRNSHDEVEYVGVSSNTKKRLYQHTRCKRNETGHGMFYGRKDLIVNIVQTYETRKEAMRAETLYKIELGFEPTERNGHINRGKISGPINGKLNRIFTIEQANDIKNLYTNDNYLMREIAEMYNVTTPTVRRIIRNITYND